MIVSAMSIRRRNERAPGTIGELAGNIYRNRLPDSHLHGIYNSQPNNSRITEYIAQNWTPEPIMVPWNKTSGSKGLLAHHSQAAMLEPPLSYLDPKEPDLEQSIYCWEPPLTSGADTLTCQPYLNDQRSFGYGYDYQIETTMRVATPPQHQLAYSPPILDETNYFQLYSKQPNYTPTPSISNNSISSATTKDETQVIESVPQNATATTPSPYLGLTLDWSTCNSNWEESNSSPSLQRPAPVLKRKRSSPPPANKKIRQRSPTPDPALAGFVVVFENAPGALSAVKHRRKLDAPVRKAAQAVRKAGACHQCRFRKRTCSTGTPCTSCLKNGNGLHELKCQRESPFVERTMHEYFEYSSTRRIVSFEILVPSASSNMETVEVDGIGRLSLPIKLRAAKRTLESFGDKERQSIDRTKDSRPISSDTSREINSVLLLESNPNLGVQIEQWAVNYASKFVHAADPSFHSTTMAVILGTAYVKKKLPESDLVASMLRVASLSFVLRAGVCVKHNSSSTHRTIQATIDTILYQRLQLAEEALFNKLQSLIFRTAGHLTRSQIYPVALVLFQLLRISCIAASHLGNISRRFPHNKVDKEAHHQFLVMRLVLSTHLALFRSSCPLLFNFEEEANKQLFGGDKELIRLAKEMKRVVRTFREKGFPDMRGSMAYRKEYFELFRKVYDGL